MGGADSGEIRFGATARSGCEAAILAAPMAPQLQDAVWTLGPSRDGPVCQAFLVTGGRARFVREGAQGEAGLDLTAPALLWLPAAARGAFRLEAGGEGARFAATEEVFWRALGHTALAADVKPLLARTLAVASERLAPHLAELTTTFAVLIREARERRPGSATVTDLQTGLLLMLIWRASALARPDASGAGGATTVQRFRQLVELHYRDNLGVARLADLAGVTRSRLHRDCLSATGRTPLALVHERLIEEARRRLEQTAQPVEQIGYGLGFRDAGYFNRFFKRCTGMTPGQHRRAFAPGARRDGASYAAWP